MRWKCALCDTEHDSLPLCYGAAAPWRLLGVTEEEFSSRVELNADLCVVDEEQFFVRGHIELPILESAEVFSWSVWCSLSRESFERLMTRWNALDRDADEPYFGWLMSLLPTYPDTLHLKTHVRNRKPGLVPLIEVEPTDHPLAVEQGRGISWERVQQIAHVVLGHEVAGAPGAE